MRSVISSAAVALLATTASAVNYDITVGKGGLVFDPENIEAAHPGDTLTYHFFAKNHAVTQSSFDKPCQPLEGGFFSGFTPNESPDVASATTFTVTVNDTKPIWVYCAQTAGNHCQSGMVQAINAPPAATFDDFKALALAADKPSSSPEDGLPVGGLRSTFITVGADSELAFSPDNIKPLVGEVLRFSFNPKNHSVVQSSFKEPCVFLDDGFSSGFVPTGDEPSGVYFDVVVEDDKPIWFYCAQLAGGVNPHCQAGMVGAANAADEGDFTLDAFRELANKAGPSTIPEYAPKGGVLSFKGTTIVHLKGNVLNVTELSPDMLSHVPPPGEAPPAYLAGMAGGAPPASYGWADNMSPAAVSALQLLHYVDNVLTTLLVQGHLRLSAEGSWYNVYPPAITSTIGSMAAQSIIHRRTSTDCLQHYESPLVPLCDYSFDPEADGVTPFLDAVLKLSLLSVGAHIDAIAQVAESDSWLIPVLASQLGAKTRMAALVNLMQGHSPAAAPREVQVPTQLVYSYVKNHFVGGGCSTGMADIEETWGVEVAQKMTVGEYEKDSDDRTVKVKVGMGDEGKWEPKGSDYYVAWMGAWGSVEYSEVDGEGHTDVPTTLYGHVWAVVTKGKDKQLGALEDVAVAGPAMVWVSQP